MKVIKQRVKVNISSTESELMFQIEQNYAELMKRVSIQQYTHYQASGLSQLYSMTTSNTSNRITFVHQFVLQSNDNHSLLKGILKQLVDCFLGFRITFPYYLLNQMRSFLLEINKDQNVIVGQIVGEKESQSQRQLVLVCAGEEAEVLIDVKMRRLQQFKKEVLLYNTDYYMNKYKMDIPEYKHFLKGMIHYYSKDIQLWLYKQLKKLGLQDHIYIKDIQPFFTSQNNALELSQSKYNNSNQDYKYFTHKSAISFTVFGFEQTFSKLFKFVEKWMQRLNFMRLCVQEIVCCRRQDINQHFKKLYKTGICVLLPKEHDRQSIIIFQPPKSKIQLEKQIQTTKRLITGLDFKQLDAQFTVIFQERKEFVQFMQTHNVHIKKQHIYSDYLMVSGDKKEESRLRSLIRTFLEDHQFQTIQVPYFKTKFQISIFHKIYSNKIDLKVQFFLKEKKLFRKNWKQNGEVIDEKIHSILQQMKNQLIYKPMPKLNYLKEDYFRELPAPEWQDLQCLESMRFRIDQKVEIFLRSFGSLSHNEETCIFMVDQWDKCNELKSILANEQMNSDLQNKIFKNKKLGFQLRKSKNFDNIITWAINSNNLKRTRDSKWLRMLKEEIEELIEENRHKRYIKIFFPPQSETIIENIIPLLIQAIVSSSKYLLETKLKELYFFTSMNEGKSLRNSVLMNLNKIRKDGTKIQKICDLDLKTSDIDKIVSYGYVSLSYFENNMTKLSTNINSFIFKSELKKPNAKIPIFLPSNYTTHPHKYKEYLINCQTQQAFIIQHYSILKLKKKLSQNEQLHKILLIMKKYFKNIDYMVIYGKQEDETFDRRLFFTSSAEEHYKTLVQVDLNLEKMKINIGTLRLRYELTVNDLFSLKKIETHVSKVPQFIEIMNGTIIG